MDNQTNQLLVTTLATENVGGQATHTSKLNQRKRKNTYMRKDHAKKDERNHQFEKSKLSKISYMSPRQDLVRIFTSSNGLPTFVDLLYKALSSRVKSFSSHITLEQMKYVTTISWYARLVRIGIITGTAPLIHGSADLFSVTKGIQLPIVATRYIETLGRVRMANGQHVVPFVADYRVLIPLGSEWFYDPREPLEEAGRQIPDTAWCIDTDWIADYNTKIVPKLAKSGVVLTTVGTEVAGLEELLVGVGRQDDRELKSIYPWSPQDLFESQAGLGASYAFREYSSMCDWPFGDNDLLLPLFEGGNVTPTVLLSEIISSALMSP